MFNSLDGAVPSEEKHRQNTSGSADDLFIGRAASLVRGNINYQWVFPGKVWVHNPGPTSSQAVTV